jgi:ribose-phosphate pyrophosphokinase
VPVLIPAPGSERLAADLAGALGCEVRVPEVRAFPDGEWLVRIGGDAIAGDAIVVADVGGARFLCAAFLAGTARDLGAARVGLVAPYLAYMRQDSAFQSGEGVTARYFAKLVSSTFDWLATVDPHLHRLSALEAIYGIPCTVARAAPAIARYVAAAVERPVLVGPDAESHQWVAPVAAGCGAPHVVFAKTRRGDRDVSVAGDDGLAASLAGHTPVLVDDIVSTGRTMLEAVRLVRATGGAAPVCIAIHAVFADAVHDELLRAGAAAVVSCDTLTHPTNRISIAAELAAAIQLEISLLVA